MHLEWLRLGHVRNLDQVTIEPGPKLNIFTGRNASGKTALLEGLYLLARARSFRTARIHEVVSRERATLQVSAGIGYSASRLRATTGIEKGRGQTSIRYNGSTVKTVSEQARQIPLVLVTPDSHWLINGTPKQRRHWLDWAMFHVEPSYLQLWRDYFRALRNRNSLLKSGVRDPAAYQGWENGMVEAGLRLTQMREDFVRALSVALTEPPAETLAGPEVVLQLQRGWREDGEGFAELLATSRSQDLMAGFTRFGPHRADLLFISNDTPVAASFSRGQMKLFVCRLIMAEALVLQRLMGEPPLFLLDDYTAELDRVASKELINSLLEQDWQCFLNATEFREEGLLVGDIRRFHVEHGEVRKMIE